MTSLNLWPHSRKKACFGFVTNRPFAFHLVQILFITQFKLIVGLIIVPYPRQLDEIFAANWVSRRTLSLPRLDTPRKDDFALFKLAEILQHVTN